MLIRIEAHEDKGYDVLLQRLRGPEPNGGLGPMYVNRLDMYNLCYKLGKGRNRAGHLYEPASGPVNRRASTHVYKGTTRRLFRDNKQQLENQA